MRVEVVEGGGEVEPIMAESVTGIVVEYIGKREEGDEGGEEGGEGRGGEVGGVAEASEGRDKSSSFNLALWMASAESGFCSYEDLATFLGGRAATSISCILCPVVPTYAAVVSGLRVA